MRHMREAVFVSPADLAAMSDNAKDTWLLLAGFVAVPCVLVGACVCMAWAWKWVMLW